MTEQGSASHRLLEKEIDRLSGEILLDSPLGTMIEDTPARIDEKSKQLAMARMMLDNQKRAREQQCGAEIDAALQAILKKYKCNAKFMELREGGQTTRIWLQPVALDEQG